MANGIIEKGSAGLFENEIEFNGKYAVMVRSLREEIGLFASFREVYVISAIIGFLNDCKMTEDVHDSVQAASIFPNELSKRKQDLRFIYRLIMLLREEPDYTLEDYKNRAFKDDPEDNMDIIKQNMVLFNSYVCGGVEYLYKEFENCSRVEDVVDKLYELLHEFSAAIGLVEDDIALPDFTPDFE